MKRAFDQFEIEVLGNGKAKFYILGSKKGIEYNVSLKPKGVIERYSTKGDIKLLPNIVLKKWHMGHTIIFIKDAGSSYEFSIVTWSIFPPAYSTRRLLYATKTTVHKALNEIGGYINA